MICEIPDCQEHYGCRLKHKGIQVSAAAISSHYMDPAHRPYRPMVEPGWQETTPLVDHRPGGFGMPIHRPDGLPANLKDYSENRRYYDGILREMNRS